MIRSIKMNLKELRCEDLDWTHLAQSRDHWRAFVDIKKELSGFEYQSSSYLLKKSQLF